ncbi:MAG: hypothetical protein JSV56_05805 [Methanomassiliicoccales archaeon]|nr:MAG: hypothetical protein JSV56_05805 [Methanomassiliicoccales archaeon]
MKEQPVDAERPGTVSVRSYITRFRHDEDPISEGGIWINGKKDGIDLTDVIVKAGVAYGGLCRMNIPESRAEQGNLEVSDGATPKGDYDDPTAVLAGIWGKNQHGKAKVFSRNQTEKYFQEVEIRLRSTITPHRCTGYEVFWRCLKNENAYAEIVRWNGKIGDFTSLRRHTGPQYGVKDGDVVEATIFGNVLKGFINGVEVISATDDTFDTGSPGIGFNFGVGNTNVDFGFTFFEVHTYDD